MSADDIELEMLFEKAGLPVFGIPSALRASYGGDFGLAVPRVYANFVASMDGVVALPDKGESGHIISGDSKADRFVMGLLRACAGAILVGAGTFRKAPGHRWTAEAIDPARAPHFAALRQKLGLAPRPPLIVVTASGDVDPKTPALEDGYIVTTRAGSAELEGRTPESVRVVAIESVDRLAATLAFVRAEGFGAILTEGGPSFVGELVAQGLLDELFLTTSPRLFGRADGDGRKSLIAGVGLDGVPLDLVSARREGSHLFLRYALPAHADVP